MTVPRSLAGAAAHGLVRDHGFTLIEVLVGFVIVTLGLVSFFAGLGVAYRQMAESRLRQSALAHARSHLDQLAAQAGTLAGTSAGRYPQGPRWRLTARPLAGPAGATGPAGANGPGPAAEARLVVLDTFDARGRLLLRLKTVTLAPVPR